MANKKNKQINTGSPAAQKQPVRKQEPVQQQKADAGFMKRYSNIVIPAAIALITWLFLKVCLNDGFTNWDDPGYIKDDALIRDISLEGLKHIFSFSSVVQGNYHPFTILSYAIEYSFVHFEPWLYHLDSLLFHILVTMLVYRFVLLLTGRQVAAGIVALLFALHPMHMESVAWLSGRKDVVYGLFYVAACIAWVYYIRAADTKKWGWYIGVLVLFLCSLLAKPVAVILPVTLLLIDYFEKRKLTYWLLVEKIPHFALSIILGIKSIHDQNSYGALKIKEVHFTFIERISLGGYALFTYLWKAIAPVGLSCIYPYPEKPGLLPLLAVVAIIAVILIFGRKNKIVVFGSLFFLVNIALLLQFIPVGEAIIAERYTYIPYLGLFFIAGWFVSGFFEPGANKQTGYLLLSATLVYSLFLGYLANERCQVWYSTTSLWSDQLEKQPQHSEAYNNLGFDYFTRFDVAPNQNEKKTDFDSCYYLLNKAIALQPDYQSAYITLGDLERSVGRYDEAEKNYYTGISLRRKDDEWAKAYMGLGIIYAIGNRFDSSAFCFRTALQLRPDFPEANSNFGNLYAMTGKHDSALIEYGLAIAARPDAFSHYLNRGRELQRLHRCDEAIKDFDKAIALSNANGEIYYARSFCYAENGNKQLALQDVDKAISLGFKQVDRNYYEGLKK